MLELAALRRCFDETVALDGLSLDVAPGQLFGFVGPNGAGKTTTMRIIIGVLAADSGEVRWKGVRLDALKRRRIGYMPEEGGLYPKMQVGEQLVYFARLHGVGSAEADAAARRWMGAPRDRVSGRGSRRAALARQSAACAARRRNGS